MNRLKERIMNASYVLGKNLLSKPNTYPSEVHSASLGNQKIRELICSGQPIVVSRFGANEINYSYRAIHGLRIPFKFRKSILNAGVFPLKAKSLEQFSKTYYSSISGIDLIGVWNCSEYEGKAISEKCNSAYLTELRAIEPYYFDQPWSNELKGKTVLVISPFTDTIRMQFEKRKTLFANPDILPDFNLKTYRSVQSIGGNISYENWQEALLKMQGDIDKIDFDIAIIGAGAYGLPLASYVKQRNKQAIHMGGATQILFGIKGKRWESHEQISQLFNEDWVFPSESERPDSYKNVEGGCYW